MSASKKPPIIRRSPIDNLFTSLEDEGVRPFRQVKSIALSRIDANPLQPRRRLDEAAIAELTESIRVHDLQNPINVCLIGDRYLIISGHMRFEAFRRLGRTEIPALVRTIADQADGLVKALIENVQRTDLDPIDEARSYRELMTLRDWSLREVARQVGKSPAHVQGRVSLLSDAAITAAVERGLAARTAAEIARIPDAELRHQVLERAEVERLDINTVVQQIRAARAPALVSEEEAGGESPGTALIPVDRDGAAARGPETLVIVDGEVVGRAGRSAAGEEEPPVDRGEGPAGREYRWLGRVEAIQRQAASLAQDRPRDLAEADRARAVSGLEATVATLRQLLADLADDRSRQNVH